jgi:hypothetical protein
VNRNAFIQIIETLNEADNIALLGLPANVDSMQQQVQSANVISQLKTMVDYFKKLSCHYSHLRLATKLSPGTPINTNASMGNGVDTLSQAVEKCKFPCYIGTLPFTKILPDLQLSEGMKASKAQLSPTPESDPLLSFFSQVSSYSLKCSSQF